MKKNLEILQKNSEILFFPRSNPFSTERTRHQPHSQGLLHFLNGRQTRKIMVSYRTTAWYKKVASTAFFFISLSLYGTSIPRKYSIFIQQLSSLHFRRIFSKKPWDIWSLVLRPWEMTKNRETHGRTVRVGRSTLEEFVDEIIVWLASWNVKS